MTKTLQEYVAKCKARHDARQSDALVNMESVLAWCDSRGIECRLVGANLLQLKKQPRGFASWVFTRGRITTCRDWSVKELHREKVQTYRDAIRVFQAWIEG